MKAFRDQANGLGSHRGCVRWLDVDGCEQVRWVIQ